MAEQATAEAVATEQVAGQENQQEVQPESQPNDDEMRVSVLRSNFSHLAPDGDVNKVIHMANEYKQMQDSGLVALGQTIADNNMNPYGVLAEWNTNGEQPDPQPQSVQPVQVQQVQQPAQQTPQGQQPPPTQSQEGQFVTPDQLNQLVKQEMTTAFQDHQQNNDLDNAKSAQQGFIDSSLDSLGYKSAPTKFTLAGTDQELTPVRDLLIQPAILLAAQRIHAQGLNPNAPDYKDRLYDPMSQQTVTEATAVVKQVLGLIGIEQQELESDNQVDLPVASLADGQPGGRVKKNVKDMSADEKKEQFLEWEAQKRAARGG